ncbi:hypothetical protein RFI_03983 [Reticulomyxa filosa]|uniref:Kelch motif family protein n=1 Tax=Reticulomyxa filosa TaxID=46433 RepID=X6P4W6_RETFI|nr:hypothetical protein RFI_03983 [Reticulomyxa filosa]|eukprot:ETO33124.1 hypothetical protein RFI_03983 [Reticulomyxa filosa]
MYCNVALPTPLRQAQCVLYKDELIICGGALQKDCYSYHTIKNEYKFICKYPTNVKLDGHCVVKLIGNNKNSNEITLLSFGGWIKHTLVMKYVSVWSNDNEMNKSEKSINYNRWVPFTDNKNHPVNIGGYQDSYIGVHALIGGSNNHLLFITYLVNNISVFDLNTFQFIKHDKLPTGYIKDNCFVSKSENGQEMMRTNKEKNNKIYEMLLFCKNTGLSIEYDEDNNTFKSYPISVCDDIAPFYHYAYARINDIILFFGGWSDIKRFASKSVYKYSIQEKKWMAFQNALPSALYNCIAIPNEENTYIHIIGGGYDENSALAIHMKTKVRVWDPLQLSKSEIKFVIQYWIRTSKIKLVWVYDLDKFIFKYSK